MQRPQSPLLSIVVPALNECGTLAGVLDALLALRLGAEIIVIDDGSSDDTGVVAERYSKRYASVTCIRHASRQGKGAGILDALAVAHGRYFAVQDADLEYDPADIPACLQHMRTESLDALYGSRFMKDNPTAYPLFYWGNKAVSAWVSVLTGVKITDAYTGRKLYRTAFMRGLALSQKDFAIEAEMAVKTALAARHGAKFAETPIGYKPRKISDGKKIRPQDGLSAFWLSLAYRFNWIK
ncbi:MAG: glycosyltransferase family 2 protein [Elusimicrobiota bacterium]